MLPIVAYSVATEEGAYIGVIRFVVYFLAFESFFHNAFIVAPIVIYRVLVITLLIIV